MSPAPGASPLKFRPLFGDFHSAPLSIIDLSFPQSEAPDRHGDDGGRRAVPQNQSAQTLYRKDGKPGYKTGKAT